MICTYVFYPGYLTADSLQQLAQAYYFSFNDMHPPIMAFVWHYLLYLLPGSLTLPMMFLQLLWFWGALALWVYMLGQKKWSYVILIPIVGFFPNIIAYSGIIWKDIQMGDSLLLAFTLLAFLQLKNYQGYFKYLLQALMVLLVFYAFSVRHEAVLACLPFFYVWACYLFAWARRRWKFLFTLYMALLFAVLSHIFSWLVNAVPAYAGQATMLYDLAGLSIAENKMLIPLDVCAHPKTCFSEVKTAYDPGSVWPVVDSFTHQGVLIWTFQPQQYQEIKKAWFKTVLHHPWLYLKERMRFFARDWIYSYILDYNFVSVSQGTLSVVLHAKVTHEWMFFYRTFAIFFVMAIWFVVNCGTLLFLSRQNYKNSTDAFLCLLSQSMLWSGLLIFLSHFFLAASSEFRYFYWTMLSTLLSCVVVFLQVNKQAWQVKKH